MHYEIWTRYRTFLLIIGILLFTGASFVLYSPTSDKAKIHPLESHAYASENRQQVGNPPATDKDTTTASQTPLRQEASANRKSGAAYMMFVDVKGAVKMPGIYPLLANERMQHIVAKAGGFLPEADMEQINLAMPLRDGDMVMIPKKGKPSPCQQAAVILSSVSPSESVGNSIQTTSTTSTTSTSASEQRGSTSSSGKININTADAKELMKLSGVGETRAQAIIAYREKNGPFASIEDLKRVAGIGEKTFEKLKRRITTT